MADNVENQSRAALTTLTTGAFDRLFFLSHRVAIPVRSIFTRYLKTRVWTTTERCKTMFRNSTPASSQNFNYFTLFQIVVHLRIRIFVWQKTFRNSNLAKYQAHAFAKCRCMHDAHTGFCWNQRNWKIGQFEKLLIPTCISVWDVFMSRAFKLEGSYCWN